MPKYLHGTVAGVGLLGGGIILSVALAAPAAQAATETVLYSFQDNGTDGTHPWAGLINAANTLYGTTTEGGTNSAGTVFSLDLKKGAETVLHSFGSGTDGIKPYAGLIKVKGMLYGTTYEGGSDGVGTVFSLDRKIGTEAVVYSFQDNGMDGNDPRAGLIKASGMLYGTTWDGGADSDGTVFSLDPETGAETVLHSFASGTDGSTPFDALIRVKGMLYGTTSYGGIDAVGTVFSLDRKTGTETVLHFFGGGTDGSHPYAGLIDVNGTFYGTTDYGGTDGVGSVFSLDPKTSAETVVYSFQNQPDGGYPQAGLTSVNGTLYGTTFEGGTDGVGTVFSVDPTTGTETVVHSFQNEPDGSYPYAGLIDVNGTLYGTTYDGGASGDGTVFSITP
ncbi:MAG TPA: choice-of-anchor tandem repeat GloVer-containing protein [Rhizomicrobium sp.]|jgi:uncharacterized repeat protein (TIGR03803 family)|nr:choice-of-anchor tandem repeat GloVer-containing protein [Rhizomicrobium sp.]